MIIIVDGYEAHITEDIDGAFDVEFPELPGCLTCAETLEEAIEFAREALALYLEPEDA